MDTVGSGTHHGTTNVSGYRDRRHSNNDTLSVAQSDAGEDVLYEQLSAQHEQRQRALMKSINYLQRKVKYLTAAHREDKRSRYIQKLTREVSKLNIFQENKKIYVKRRTCTTELQLRNQQKVVEILRKTLTNMTDLTSDQIDDMLLRKGIGAPKRFQSDNDDSDEQERIRELENQCGSLREQNEELRRKNMELYAAMTSTFREQIDRTRQHGGFLPNIHSSTSKNEHVDSESISGAKMVHNEEATKGNPVKLFYATDATHYYPAEIIDKLEKEVIEKDGKLQQQEDEVEELRHSLAERNQAHSKLKSKYYSLKEEDKSERSEVEEKLRKKETECNHLCVELEDCQGRLKSIRQRLARQQQEKTKKYEKEISDYKTALDELKKKHSLLLENYYQGNHDSLGKFSQQVSKLKQEIELLKNSKQDLHACCNGLTDTMKTLQEVQRMQSDAKTQQNKRVNVIKRIVNQQLQPALSSFRSNLNVLREDCLALPAENVEDHKILEKIAAAFPKPDGERTVKPCEEADEGRATANVNEEESGDVTSTVEEGTPIDQAEEASVATSWGKHCSYEEPTGEYTERNTSDLDNMATNTEDNDDDMPLKYASEDNGSVGGFAPTSDNEFPDEEVDRRHQDHRTHDTAYSENDSSRQEHEITDDDIHSQENAEAFSFQDSISESSEEEYF